MSSFLDHSQARFGQEAICSMQRAEDFKPGGGPRFEQQDIKEYSFSCMTLGKLTSIYLSYLMSQCHLCEN